VTGRKSMGSLSNHGDWRGPTGLTLDLSATWRYCEILWILSCSSARRPDSMNSPIEDIICAVGRGPAGAVSSMTSGQPRGNHFPDGTEVNSQVVAK
jgi:hypothetical protein